MKLQEQFGGGTRLNLRSYRNLLDAVGACENLPVALVSRQLSDDHLLVSSFSAPLFELLRSRTWFKAFERKLIEAAFDRHPEAFPHDGVRLSYSSRLEGRVIAQLIPAPEPGTFILCGPVWLRNDETLREPFTRNFVEGAAKHIVDMDRGYSRLPANRSAKGAPLRSDDIRGDLRNLAGHLRTGSRVARLARSVRRLEQRLPAVQPLERQGGVVADLRGHVG